MDRDGSFTTLADVMALVQVECRTCVGGYALLITKAVVPLRLFVGRCTIRIICLMEFDLRQTRGDLHSIKREMQMTSAFVIEARADGSSWSRRSRTGRIAQSYGVIRQHRGFVKNGV